MDNIILRTDSYKFSHWKQYPPGTTHVYSYFESRGGMYDNVVFFGLQYILKKYLLERQVYRKDIEQAEEFSKAHFGSDTIFNKAGWYHILIDHEGRIPVEIKAVAEGTVVSTQNVLLTVENTCPQCFWVTSYLETLLEQVWYPCTIATKSRELKKIIKQYLDKTGDDIPDFKLHDFGYRGSTSQESAGIGDAAHLVNFKGTDTVAGIQLLQEYYAAKDMPAFSIPAAEHGTITSWGKEKEADAFENMLSQFPSGLVAVVSDSYDIYNAVKNIWGEKLKDKVINRNGVLVIRPDSGHPATVIKSVLETLGESFGFTTNSKGYKVLPSYLRIIQGDGIDEKTLPEILKEITASKWSADNIAFGSGGGLLQNVTRDTLRFAYKCSNITINEKDQDVFKKPVTDPEKVSKKGRLTLMKVDDGYATINNSTTDEWSAKMKDSIDQLQTVFKDGELLIDQTLDEIRSRAQV